MNYRLLLTEMLIDYCERRDETECGKTYKIYTEIINDLQLALEIEPSQIGLIQSVQDILNDK